MRVDIFICTVQDKDLINNIIAAIVKLGVNVSAASNSKSLYHSIGNDTPAIIGISANNFNDKLKLNDILDRICLAISNFKYFGIVITSDYSTSWRGGNAPVSDVSTKLQKANKTYAVEINNDVKVTKVTDVKINANPKDDKSENKIDLSTDLPLITKLLRCTTTMSDVFFDNVPKEERILLADKVEALLDAHKKSV